ncbi:MAG: 4-hydroxythreonine-4-phosphate dehydrogenase PdxA [Gemmatimonadota bacterium]
MRPGIGITLGDPRGIGPEVAAAALAARGLREAARYVLIGPAGVRDARGDEVLAWEGDAESVGEWEPDGGARLAGELSARALERGIALATAGRIDGLVTGPISKSALQAAGYPFPGHTEFLRDRTGVGEVTMMMAAERTPVGGPLRLALLTTHLPLRDVPSTLTESLAVRRTRLAVRALRDWWGIPRPRVAFAGVNPHAGEGGLFGDEEARVLEPAIERLEADGDAELLGVFPADTVFRHALEGSADVVVVPYHDVGLAVLKTLARDEGVNVTAGLPFPRTSPDHGTAFDIAGTGAADPGAMIAAIELCIRFCNAGVAIR